MAHAWQTRTGYFFFGLMVGVFAFPFVFVALLRTGAAQTRDPLWAAIVAAILLAPALISLLVGWNRTARARSALPPA